MANPQYPVTGYPSFNAPKILEAQAIGVDMVTNGPTMPQDYSARGALGLIANLVRPRRLTWEAVRARKIK